MHTYTHTYTYTLYMHIYMYIYIYIHTHAFTYIIPLSDHAPKPAARRSQAARHVNAVANLVIIIIIT